MFLHGSLVHEYTYLHALILTNLRPSVGFGPGDNVMEKKGWRTLVPSFIVLSFGGIRITVLGLYVGTVVM